MRRRLLIVCLLIGVGAGTPVAAEPAGQTRALTLDHLEADWVVPADDGDGLRWYVVDVQVATDRRTGDIVASDAFGGVGQCSDDGGECWVRPKPLRVVDYYSDDALQTSTVVLRGQGMHHRVRFFATTRYSGAFDARLQVCRGQRLWYSLPPRNARAAKGTVFNETVDTETEFEPDSESMQRTVVV
ncbi:MAG: hypothetical protein LC799_22085, partial [Actinobacteria bacterium]|nr:hypothetical protein [Actinomycetota bacterium]